MQVEYVTQISSKEKGFWQPNVIDNGDGTVTLQPATFYFQNYEISVPQETWTPQEGDRVYIENDVDPVHLIRDGAADDYIPLFMEKESSPGIVIWMHDGTLFILTHEEG